MQQTYKLAKVGQFGIYPFGPVMTLNQAESYQADMEKGGFSVVIVNMETATQVKKGKTRQDRIQAMVKRDKRLSRHSLLTV